MLNVLIPALLGYQPVLSCLHLQLPRNITNIDITFEFSFFCCCHLEHSLCYFILWFLRIIPHSLILHPNGGELPKVCRITLVFSHLLTSQSIASPRRAPASRSWVLNHPPRANPLLSDLREHPTLCFLVIPSQIIPVRQSEHLQGRDGTSH